MKGTNFSIASLEGLMFQQGKKKRALQIPPATHSCLLNMKGSGTRAENTLLYAGISGTRSKCANKFGAKKSMIKGKKSL